MLIAELANGSKYMERVNAALSAPPTDLPTKIMFVCASLFAFNTDQTRREAGYPYLQYVEGEVFDVVAHKGELWLAYSDNDAK